MPSEQENTASEATTSSPSFTRVITDEDKKDLTEALHELQSRESGMALFDETSSHGISSELISDIVDNSSTIFSLEDITEAFPVFSVMHALKILEIFHELFGDILQLQETVELLGLLSTGAATADEPVGTLTMRMRMTVRQKCWMTFERCLQYIHV